MKERIRDIPGVPEENEAAPGGRNPSLKDLQERAILAQGINLAERAQEAATDVAHRKERARGLLGIKEDMVIGREGKAQQMAALRERTLEIKRAQAETAAVAPETQAQVPERAQKAPQTVGERVLSFFKALFE